VISAITWSRFGLNAGVGVVIAVAFIALGVVLSRRGPTQPVPGDPPSPKAERARGSLAATGLVLIAFGVLFLLLAIIATLISLIGGHPV
jgi:hypothetical protein